MNLNTQIILKPFDESKKNLQDRKMHYQPSSNIILTDKNDVELVKSFAHAVCREYLSGAWKQVDINNFKIQRIS